MRVSVSEIAASSRAATAGSLLNFRAAVKTRATLQSPLMTLSSKIGIMTFASCPSAEEGMLSITWAVLVARTAVDVHDASGHRHSVAVTTQTIRVTERNNCCPSHCQLTGYG